MSNAQVPTNVYTEAMLTIEARKARQAKRSRISMWLIAAAIVIALAIVAFGPLLSPNMTSDQYGIMVGTTALVGIMSIVLGLVYFALSEGHPLKVAIEYVTILMFVVVIASSPPVSGFVARFFFGGLEAAIGH